jgi:pimeloyl-ACP methyl ester carboxylesterase
VMARALTMLACLALAGCAAPDPVVPDVRPMLTLVGDPDRTRDLVIVIPGALTSVHAYDDVPLAHGAALVGYRFPGIDGRPRDRPVKIGQAGAEIAAYVRAHPARQVRLIGMSTGGPIALEAAKRIHGSKVEVEVAILSSALPAPATALATVAGLSDIADASGRAHSLDRIEVFGEYYRTLLLGRGHYRNPALATYSADVAERIKTYLRLPGDGITRSQGANLLVWTLQHPEDLSGTRILFLHGAQDPVFPIAGVRRLAARLPEARVITYPLSGHLLLATEPSVYADMEAAFREWGGKGAE